MFIIKGKNIRNSCEIRNARIIDLAPTILYLMNLPIPESVDGQVLVECLEDEYLKHNHIRYSTPSNTSPHEPTQTDDVIVQKRLEALGYLD